MPDGAAVAVMQTEREAPVTYQSMLRALKLEGELFKLLDDAFLELHLMLEDRTLSDWQNNPICYSRIMHDEGALALLHLHPGVLTSPGGDQHFQPLGVLFSNEAARLCFFTEAEGVPVPFKRIANLWQRSLRSVQRIDFFTGTDIQYLGMQDPPARARSIIDLLNLQPPVVAGLKVVNGAAMDRMAEIIAPVASASASPKAYFKNLVGRLGGPQSWADEMADVWIGDTRLDALRLIKWAYAKKVYPPQTPKPGYTVLGCLLEKVCEDVADPSLEAMIQQYELVTRRV